MLSGDLDFAFAGGESLSVRVERAALHRALVEPAAWLVSADGRPAASVRTPSQPPSSQRVTFSTIWSETRPCIHCVERQTPLYTL